MNQLEQTIQTYIETLYATGDSKAYELACLMKQVDEMANTFDEMSQTTTLETNVISFYTDWMLDEIEVIKPDTVENSILILIHILDKLTERYILDKLTERLNERH